MFGLMLEVAALALRRARARAAHRPEAPSQAKSNGGMVLAMDDSSKRRRQTGGRMIFVRCPEKRTVLCSYSIRAGQGDSVESIKANWDG